jgi:hypothetical protein
MVQCIAFIAFHDWIPSYLWSQWRSVLSDTELSTTATIIVDNTTGSHTVYMLTYRYSILLFMAPTATLFLASPHAAGRDIFVKQRP